MTIEERLVKSRGITDRPEFADWMLTDGRMTNGSYEGHQRDIDHAEINEFFKPSKLETPGSGAIYIKKFMRRGNIRMGVSPFGYCFAYAKTPTRMQLNKLIPGLLDAVYAKTDTYIARHTGPVTQMYQQHAMTAIQFINHLNRYVFRDNGETLYHIDKRALDFLENIKFE